MSIVDRLNSIVEKDKRTNPKFLERVIKSDFYYLINNYFEVDLEDIAVEINLNKDKYNIKISTLGDRIKLMKSLPE